MSEKDILTLMLALTPVLLIQLGLASYALLDLRRRERVRGPKWAWALGLILSAFGIPTGIIVSGIYLAWARHRGAA